MPPATASGAKPSKTLALHQGIYRANPEARGIVHTHSTHLVALTLAGVWRPDEVLPPITPLPGHEGRAHSADRLSPSRRSQVAAEVAALAAQVRGALFERLGPVVWSAPWRMPPTRSKNSRKLRACG